MGAKLIRDKMKDIPWGDEEAKKYIRKVVDNDEHIALVVAKFFEEIGELMYAGGAQNNDDDFLDELVDVYTALTTIIEMNYSAEEFQAAHKKKLEEKGGFAEGWVWDRDKYLGE